MSNKSSEILNYIEDSRIYVTNKIPYNNPTKFTLNSKTNNKTIDLIIENELGRGGFGVTYKAHYIQSNGEKKYYVIKKILITSTILNKKEPFNLLDIAKEDSVALKNIDTVNNEINILAYIKDYCEKSGILCYYNYFYDIEQYTYSNIDIKYDVYIYVLTEFVSGKTLLQFIKDNNNLSIIDKLTIATKILIPIHNLHYLDVVHRDIKLENIMISDKDNSIKLIDFGLSCLLYTSTTAFTSCNDVNILAGTILYFPPESFIDNKIETNYGKAIDIYALGIVFIELFVGILDNPIYKLCSSISTEKKKDYSMNNLCFKYLKKKYKYIKDNSLNSLFELQSNNNELNDLINSMIHIDKTKRPTVVQLYNKFYNLLQKIKKDNIQIQFNIKYN
jgi:serine/threonine protein kinase